MTTTPRIPRSTTPLALTAALWAAAACTPSADARPVRDAANHGIPGATSDAAPLARSDAPALGAPVRFTVAPTGNTARYRVREQLMGRNLPNDAVGETQAVTGGITLDDAGAPVAGQSRFVVATANLKSDSDRRDGYVRGRLLETDQYPTVTLVPTSVRGLPAPLPAAGASAGPVTFELLGDLTVHGVTRPTTWRVSARQAGGQLTGTAATAFTFAQFGLAQPRVPIVLSVADTIGLELSFTLVRDGAAAR